jgi:hypothetical protein
VEDSAVCYYFDPVLISRDGYRTIAMVLSSGDERGFARINNLPDDLPALIRSVSAMDGEYFDSLRTDLIVLRDLADRLNGYISSGTAAAEDELAAIGLLIFRIRSKYGIP